MREVGPLQWGQFKPRLAEALVEHLAPIRTNYAEVMKVGRGQCWTVPEAPLCAGMAQVWALLRSPCAGAGRGVAGGGAGQGGRKSRGGGRPDSGKLQAGDGVHAAVTITACQQGVSHSIVGVFWYEAWSSWKSCCRCSRGSLLYSQHHARNTLRMRI